MEKLIAALWRTLARTRLALAAARSFPFTYPRLAQILFATCSGVFMSAGTGLFLDAFDRPEFAVPTRYWAGAMFGISSFAFAGVAWSAQIFQEFLINAGKTNERIDEITNQFQSWRHHKFATFTFYCSLLSTASAFLFLIT